MFRSTIARTNVSRSAAAYARSFHASYPASKTIKENVADAADTVNKKLGRGLASAIETGQDAAAATKETLSSKTEEGKKKAGEAANAVNRKKEETAQSARQTKAEVSDKIN
ncbi:F1 atpase assembly protein 11 [Favolaschia claudopus]|uniref:F1 atpase assembly protein 11 n=1 Tax=Favolaschia claudopus TaxID=2862362 RepID=A0AAW0EK32_9AGAR